MQNKNYLLKSSLISVGNSLFLDTPLTKNESHDIRFETKHLTQATARPRATFNYRFSVVKAPIT